MKTSQPELVITEIRTVRDQHAARFGYDVKAIFRDIQARQEPSGRQYVRYPARRTAPEPKFRRPGEIGWPKSLVLGDGLCRIGADHGPDDAGVHFLAAIPDKEDSYWALKG